MAGRCGIKSLLAAFSFAGAMVVGLAQAGPPSDNPDALLKKIEEQRGKIRTLYSSTKTTVRQGNAVKTAKTKLWEKRDDQATLRRVLREVEERRSDAKKPNVTRTLEVSDGRHKWTEVPVGDTILAMKSVAKPSRELESLRISLRGTKTRIKRSGESVLGHSCLVLQAADNREKSRAGATYWIGEKHGLILKSRVTNVDGGVTEMVTTELEINKPIPDDKFVYTAPVSAQVIDTAAFGKQAGKKPDEVRKP